MRPVTRPWSSAPSVGSAKVHKEQEDLLLTTALD
jgi:2-oxoglutarate dehydrogenase complex dehydrogenase (E1) component-like enzyme